MNKKTKKGFTLVELIVVIAVLAILAAVAIPLVSSWVTEANASAAAANARTFELAVKAEAANGVDPVAGAVADADDVLANYGLTVATLTNGGKFTIAYDISNGNATGTVGGAGTVTIVD
jgi:type IV pilus assembly protein PilA